MAKLNGFDPTKVAPLPDRSPLPAGSHGVTIKDSYTKPNSKGSGSLLVLAYLVTKGEYAGREVRSWLNIDHPSETAMRLARSELSAICNALCLRSLHDTEVLHGRQLTITVRVKKRADTGELLNEVCGYAPAEAASADATKGDDAPPWSKV
ncbi:hypothetical protein Pla175_12850 [Pirellulimonas nuda]|uniref:DUF669 domain-containing protein n=1 Tax=Pirellulimonas nuda TaxID=2528009 RepID=A0A518D8W4_9BACT|nr:DUF669 domain-containing protein [Pirellulimonas nuda]QDU87918.1 hypothetical protein Pla175_12850 [Pirellulimonas nuda]